MKKRSRTAGGEPTATDQAYAGIVDLIITQRLRPGERTSVYLLSEQVGLGRTPVKEAITRLETEGILSVSERSGTLVRTLNRSETKQLFALRRTLEDFGADYAVSNVTDETLVRLRALIREMDRALLGNHDSVPPSVGFVRANVGFHALIMQAAGNPFLDRVYAQLQMQLQIVTYLVMRGPDSGAALQRQKEHKEIAAALEARNAPLLKRLQRAHATVTERAILRAMPVEEGPAAKLSA